MCVCSYVRIRIINIIYIFVLCLATFLENSKPTKKKLLNHVVNDVTTCWYDLGVMLLKEDQESRLDVIKDNHNGDNKKCCRDMLWYWLSANTDASWKQLIEALRSDAVHHPVVATKIEKVLSGMCVCTYYTHRHAYMCTYLHTYTHVRMYVRPIIHTYVLITTHIHTCV